MIHIQLIHWKIEEAEKHIDYLRENEYKVTCETFTPETLKNLRSFPPDAVIIDLNRLPSSGRDVALALRHYKSTRFLPIIFVEGQTDKVEKLKTQCPDAVYSSWDNILHDLRSAIENPPQNPIKPKSLFAGYSGKPLSTKLGIKSNSILYLYHPPENLDNFLEFLPKDVTIRTQLKDNCQLIIWFVFSQHELDIDLYHIKSAIALNGAVWIAWPKKSSGIESDLNQQIVRNKGLDAGLVDYKICSINSTWSALKFAKRK